MSPFFVFGLPRSRTRWLSVFLSYGDVVCCHDLLTQVASVRHLSQVLSLPNTGSVETGMAFASPLLRRLFPRAPFVVVRRPIADIQASLARFPGWTFLPGELEKESARLESISALPDTLTVGFDDLNTEKTCQRVFEHCLGQPFDRTWWLTLARVDLQIDMEERRRLLIEQRARILSLAYEMTEWMAPVTFQIETWNTVWPECLPLIREHATEVGFINGLPFDPDIEMARALVQSGQFIITTARVGRQLIGYCGFLITPSLESRSVLCGYNNVLFIAKPWRGQGVRLLRFAMNEMKQRHVKRLILRAGVRGSGQKLRPLFQRMGAIPDGNLYSLMIGE